MAAPGQADGFVECPDRSCHLPPSPLAKPPATCGVTSVLAELHGGETQYAKIKYHPEPGMAEPPYRARSPRATSFASSSFPQTMSACNPRHHGAPRQGAWKRCFSREGKHPKEAIGVGRFSLALARTHLDVGWERLGKEEFGIALLRLRSHPAMWVHVSQAGTPSRETAQ